MIIVKIGRVIKNIAAEKFRLMNLNNLGILSIFACLGFLAFQGNWVGLMCCLLIIALMRLMTSSPVKLVPLQSLNASQKAMTLLDVVPGMTTASTRDFTKSLPIMTLQDGTVVRTYKNPMGVDHIFLSDPEGNLIYGGFVGWIHSKGLQATIAKIRRELT